MATIDEYGFRTFSLTFKATHLPSLDFFSPSDGFLILYEKNTTNIDQTQHPTHAVDQTWVRIGHTEVIMDVESPVWQKSIEIELNQIGMLSGEFKAEVYDADTPDLMDLSDQDLIGSALFGWEIFGPDGCGTANLGLVDSHGKVVVAKNCPSATIQITSKQYSTKPRRACVTLDTTCSETDTVVQLVQITDGETNPQHYTDSTLIKEREVIVHQTPVSTNNYPTFVLNEDQLYHTPAVASADPVDGISFIVEDNPAFKIISEEVVVETKAAGFFEIRLQKWKDSMNVKLLGSARFPASPTSLSTTLPNCPAFHSFKVSKNDQKKNKEAGTVNIRTWRSTEKAPTFRDFQNSGLSYKLSFAVDCSGSGQKGSAGLHELNSEGHNVYSWALRDVAEHLIASLGASHISEIRSFGFGGPATDPHAINTKEKFALSLKSTTCDDVSDLVENYVAFTKIPFTNKESKSTSFAPFLNYYNQQVVTVKENIHNVSVNGMMVTEPTYNVLVILTDGEISDKAATYQALYDLSFKPTTVIFIGIGADATNHKFKDLLPFNTELIGDGPLKVDKHQHLTRHMTVFYPYLSFVKSLHYLQVKMFRTIAKHLTEQFFLANKFPVFKHSRKM